MKKFKFTRKFVVDNYTHKGGWKDPEKKSFTFKKDQVITVRGTYIEVPEVMLHLDLFKLLRTKVLIPLDPKIQKAWKLLSQ